MASIARLVPAETDAARDDFGLPGWAYHDRGYYPIEMDRVMRPSWQIVCHVNDIAHPGAYRTFDFLGESIMVVRGDDSVVRAMSNTCRHRAMRLVEGPSGCARKLVCPYHAWTYELDGRLSGVPMRGDYPALDMAKTGLTAIESQLWRGFVFVRLRDDGGPDVAEMMAPADAEIAPYLFEAMVPLGRPTVRARAVNWKNVGDNYSDNLHIPVAHDGLSRLMAKTYAIEARGWVDKMSGQIVARPSANFWERFYQARLPHVPHLPETAQRRWLYFKLWPNMAFDIYADQIDVMHWVPTGPTTCDLRVMAYALPDAYVPEATRRAMRAARYANDRINRTVNREDTWLIERMQQGMASALYTAGPIASSEVCLRNFARRLRTIIPEVCNDAPPESYRS